MKYSIALFIVFLHLIDFGYGALPANETNKLSLQLGRAIVQNKLKPFLENMRPVMKTGNETWNLPIIDPFEKELWQYTWTQQAITFNNSQSNLIVTGLSDYKVNNATYDPKNLKINLNMTFPNITMNSTYELHSDFMGVIFDFPVYGNGNFYANATNVTIVSNVTLSWTFLGDVYTKSIEPEISYDAVDFNVTGMFGNDYASNFLSQATTVTFPIFVEMYHPMLMDLLSKNLATYMNENLRKLSMAELFYILGTD